MLHRLHIKNIALISESDIEFDEKLNVLSGETGSGKSVILDSINFVLGSKADKTMIRFGEHEAMVRAEFIVDENSAAAQKLKEYDIETEGEIIITRKLNMDGKGSIKLNGNTVTATMLKSVTQHLVDVHGQSEHFFLLNEGNQLKVIDGICGDSIADIKHNLADLISQKRDYRSKIDALGGDESERERKLDLLKFQINEIESADLKIGEFDELKAKQNIIANTEKIFAALNTAHSLLSDDGGSIDGISTSRHYLNIISDYNEEYSQIASRLENLSVEAADIAETISDLADNLTFDEREAARIDERLSLIKALKKKYGSDEAQILQFLYKAKTEYDAISDSANAIEKYEKRIAECDEKIFLHCQKLTALRKSTADKFCKAVTSELKTLNIQNANFEVEFNGYDRQTANLHSSNGADVICFMFSANKGEPLKPLSKVISGGEMSRFMLAVKTQLKDLNGISTYIFDEIDAGISGYTAKTVAEKFIKISQNTQILAVSHLPQVCAASSVQFLIYKVEEGTKTVTKVKRLSPEEKIDELVRLTGSVSSAAATEHAKQLIDQFKN